MTPVEQITSLYVGYFGRAPDPAGLNYWVGRLNDGFSLAEIAESFSVQSEAQEMYPYLANSNIASPSTFIQQVYMNLFNRMPDAAGEAYWTAQLNNGTDVGDFILDVISGAQGVDKTIIDNKIEVGADFAIEAANEPDFEYNDAAAAAAEEVINGVDDTEESVEAGKAETDDFIDNGNVSGGGIDGETFTLTAAGNVNTGGVDTIDGSDGNDLIRAVVAASLDSTDIIDGGDGQDTLNISAGAIAAGAAPVISDVETINNAEATVDLDLTDVAGVERINSTVTGAGYTNAALATTFALSVAGTVNIAYADDQTGDSDTANIATDLEADGTAVFEFGADAAGLENVNLEIGGSDADVDTTVTLDTDLADLETITITGSGNGIVANAEVLLDTVNASAATGDITITLDANANSGADADDLTVTMGAGDDIVTLAGQVDATVTLGAGDDLLNLAGTESGLSATGGAGFDTFDFASVANLTTATEDDFASELISINGFNGSEDALDLTGVAAFDVQTLLNADQNDIEESDSLYDAFVEAGTNTTGGANGDAVIFEFDGNTYIYVDGDANGFDAGDGAIELVGFTGDLYATNFVS